MTPELARTVQLVQLARAAGAVERTTRRMPRAIYPHLIEVEYARMLIGVVRAARELSSAVRAPDVAPGRALESLDAARATMRAAALRMAGRVAQVAVHVLDHQARQLDRQTRAMLGVGIGVLGVSPHAALPASLRQDARKRAPRPPDEQERIQAWVSENVALIRSLGDVPLAEVEQAIARAFAAGVRHETLARELVERFAIAEDRARKIARDQIGKLNGRISADRHQRMGLTRFTWRDVGDQRVRPLHRHLSGQVFEYAKPPREGLPGTPILCRCHDEPIFDDVLAELDRIEAQPDPQPAPTLPRRRKAR